MLGMGRNLCMIDNTIVKADEKNRKVLLEKFDKGKIFLQMSKQKQFPR